MGILKSSFSSAPLSIQIRLLLDTNHNTKDVDQVLITACLVAVYHADIPHMPIPHLRARPLISLSSCKCLHLPDHLVLQPDCKRSIIDTRGELDITRHRSTSGKRTMHNDGFDIDVI
jgi:hypothetical protein